MHDRFVMSVLRLLVGAVLWSLLALPASAYPEYDRSSSNIALINAFTSARAVVSDLQQFGNQACSEGDLRCCHGCGESSGRGAYSANMTCGSAPCWSSGSVSSASLQAGLVGGARTLPTRPYGQHLAGRAPEPHERPPRI